MGRIRILSDTVANQIAAGEVVERPASVVKELLENSLDAGATDLRLDIESGGRRLIRIADNGCGMLRDDALLAFERHATSKLANVKDLLAIATLGFRGEALPSIASVSRLVLETRAEEETTGTRIEIAGGKLLKVDEMALPRGTTITVRDLFFNVPARKKFLRTEPTELAHIAALVTHYSLAHPDKSFQLRHGASELLSVTPVAEIRERVFQVFGSQVLSELVDLGTHEREFPSDEPGTLHQYRLRGFVSGPQVQKLNRNSIYLFVNGRLIRDRLLLHGLTAGYTQLIPPGTYPFALLFLECEPSEVDVNVHPSKTEVRFRQGSFVHDFVRDSVRRTLTQARPISAAPPPLTPALPQAGASLPYSEFSQVLQGSPPPPGELFTSAELLGRGSDAALPNWQLRPEVGPSPRFNFGEPELPPPVVTAATHPGFVRGPVPDTHGGLPAGTYTEAINLEALQDLRPLGQLHDSFIIAAGRDGLWIIDQHVAHERILFEQVLRQQAAGQVERQQLLVPLVLELTAGQEIEYERIAQELDRAGFDTAPVGKRAIAVQSAPADLGPAQAERVVLEILETAESELRRVSLEEIRRNVAASIGCRAAIKINMPLDFTKMEWLLKRLGECEYPMSCPHGRPIALRYSMREILKSFHRI
ncbi:MAG: DNA mismatch repair endonuclease MutL [Bryobacteraceae bacterium]|nr:DNA mismatch repair endonuclease MutL [Bryobacteraceae bacterium]